MFESPGDADEIEAAVEGVAAFFGFGPSIVCVLCFKIISLITAKSLQVTFTYFPGRRQEEAKRLLMRS